MPFPESERVVFRENPIVEVICQLRFPPILEISATDPASFQKQIRGEYPLYEREDGAALPKEIAELISQIPGVRAPDEITHRFLTEDRKRSISLTRAFVAISDGRYERWERFLHDIRVAKSALESTYQPAFYSRVGLRYRNEIRRGPLELEDRRWADLIRPQFLGLLGEGEIEPHVTQAQAQTMVSLGSVTPGGFAVIRQGVQTPDAEQVYTIDVDLFTQEKKNGDDVFQVLGDFNRIDGNLFRWAIQPALREALGPQRPD